MTSFDEALKSFAAALAEEERSAETIRCYLSQLRQFGTWFRGHYGMDVDPAQMTSVELREYKQHLVDLERKPTSINTARAAIAAFSRWLEKSGGPTVQPPKSLPEQKGPPRWLNRKEELSLLRVVERSSNKIAGCAVILLLHTGLRIGEASALRFNDAIVTARKGSLVVRWGKRKKRREVPLNPEARAALAELRSIRSCYDNDPVFLGQRGAMTSRGLYRLIAALGEAAKLEGFSPHVLRHTYCKRLAEKGARIEQIAALAGHDSLETTRRYLEPGWEELAALVDRLAG